jgi:hypothetical protein
VPLFLEPLTPVVPAFTWIESDGTEHDLTVLVGMAGALMPEMELSLRPSARRHGSQLQSVRMRARALAVPLVVQESSSLAMRAKVRQVLSWFDPTTSLLDGAFGQAGRWRFRAIDGTEREAYAIYTGGLEGPEGPGGLFADHWLGIAEFTLPNPLWSDVTDQATTFSLASATPKGLFDTPFFPIILSASQVLDRRVILNDGDGDAWPRWVIQGPGANPTLRAGDASLRIERTLTVADQILIDTAPGIKSVTDQYGNNLYQDVTTDSVLWPLRDGSNTVQVEIDGATAATLVTLAYRREYLTY